MNANDYQVGGSHYSGAVQHWDFVLDVLHGRYLEGNITKYVARHRKKNGAQDLEKALHYLDKLRESKNLFPPMGSLQYSAISSKIENFCKTNKLTDRETLVMYQMATWRRDADIVRCRETVEFLLQEAKLEFARAQALKAAPPAIGVEADPMTSSFFASQEPGAGYVKQD